MLGQVFERGVGAYNTNSQSSSDKWALARVNIFLRALSSGRFRSELLIQIYFQSKKLRKD